MSAVQEDEQYRTTDPTFNFPWVIVSFSALLQVPGHGCGLAVRGGFPTQRASMLEHNRPCLASLRSLVACRPSLTYLRSNVQCSAMGGWVGDARSHQMRGLSINDVHSVLDLLTPHHIS